MDRNRIRQAADIIRGAKQCFISTGAGISKESGVPTFRDALTGLWQKYNPEDLATPEAFLRDPDGVWSWYWGRAELLRQVEPNPGHYAIADLQRMLPRVSLFTQNTDGLHARAGSPDVHELHGSLTRYRCFNHCSGVPTIIDIGTVALEPGKAPRCPYCHEAYIRPDEVWFNENLPVDLLDQAFHQAETCDVMIVVGTSGVVQPAASLPFIASQHGASVIEFNMAPSNITPITDLFIAGPSGESLPAVVAAIREGGAL